jgi:hypothetical protein
MRHFLVCIILLLNPFQFSFASPPNKNILLNGYWDVSISEDIPTNYTSKVPVPGVITMATPKLGDDLDGINLKPITYNYVWYKTEFDLDEEGYSEAIIKVRAKYNAMVILNDFEIGYDHYSTYSHAEFNVSKALNLKGRNTLIIRVGSWNTSSSPSKDNSSEWWRNSRAPGIWDDVVLELGQSISIRHIKILPDIYSQETTCSIEINNSGAKPLSIVVSASIEDNEHPVSTLSSKINVPVNEKIIETLILPSKDLKTWSAGKEGNPKLYTMTVSLSDETGKVFSKKSTPFGYRSVKVQGKDVIMNGEKIIFRAENIAFPRALNRWANVMFDDEWIRNFLRTAIHEYNFNYIRFHLGHAYSKWYDIADQEGIMLHDEWRYMHDNEPVGKEKEEATIEFKRWIADNVNHPSIVTWDQENEGNVRLDDLKEELRKYDPTRLWGEDDFMATHVYEYSENIVTSFNYEIPNDKPSTVLESCRLWLNEFGVLEPREDFKTSRTASGWGMFFYTKDDIAQLLSDLHADIGTFYRSHRIQAWAPFALLSGSVNGQNFFLGDITDSLSPQSNLITLKELNEPIGASVDMLQAREWYKDKVLYKPKGTYKKNVWVWNDFPRNTEVKLTVSISSSTGQIISSENQDVYIPASGAVPVEFTLKMPKEEGCYIIKPSLTFSDGTVTDGVSRRIMVASTLDSNIEEYKAFGGRRNPVKNSYSVIETFVKHGVPLDVQKRIIDIVGNGLIDKINMEEGKNLCSIQFTEYLPMHKQKINTIVFSTTDGEILSSKKAEAMPFVVLPQNIKEVIVAALDGRVPVDESKITITRLGEDTIYQISMIGDDYRHRITISKSGKIKDKTAMKKSGK